MNQHRPTTPSQPPPNRRHRGRARHRPILLIPLFLVFLSRIAIAHEAPRFPPGVPQKGTPPGDNLEYDIKFHDPNEYRDNQQQQQQQQQVPQPPGGFRDGRAVDRQPQPRGHHHSFGGGRAGKLDIQHEREHMKEHLEEEYIDLDSMTEPQLMAQYFRTFDLDKNGKIDGLEMLKAMLKMDKEHGEGDNSIPQEDIMDMLEELDEELRFYDNNDDGYIYYSEFMRNHKQRIKDLNENDY